MKILKFNFTYCSQVGEQAKEDSYSVLNRLIFLSSDLYKMMLYKYQGNKKTFIEDISIDKININVPKKFRDENHVQTNEKIKIFRIYPAGRPNGSANPRVIGMIRNTIFYVFYIDWKGIMYNHN